MKNTIKFTTPAIFGLATVLADINSLECAIDNEAKVIWTDDVNGFKNAFDNGGIDDEEFIVEVGNKSIFNKLLKKIEQEKISNEKLNESEAVLDIE
jgi:hypothetical protein